MEVIIGSSDGSTHRQYTVQMRLFDSTDQQFTLNAMTSHDVGDQQGPSPTTTSWDFREYSSIECESCYPGAIHVVSRGQLLVTFLVDHDCVPIKIPKIAGII